MKSSLFTACLIILTGLAQGALTLGDSVTLDIKYTKGTEVGSAFEDYKTNASSISSSSYIDEVFNSTLKNSWTFYVKASDMYSTSAVTDTTQYKLNTFSFAVSSDNHYYGGHRQMKVLNMTTNASCTADFSTSIDNTTHITTLTFGNGINFVATDILQVTISSTDSAEQLRYMWADRKGGTSILITGAASELVDGAMNYEDYSQHVHNTTKYQNVPIVSMTATVMPEPATATLSLLALVGVAARRRRKAV